MGFPLPQRPEDFRRVWSIDIEEIATGAEMDPQRLALQGQVVGANGDYNPGLEVDQSVRG